MLLARVINMIGGILLSLYQAMVNRFVIPVIEEHKARGREEGRAEGRYEAMAEWAAWNQRRLAAERAGEVFTEPPPSN